MRFEVNESLRMRINPRSSHKFLLTSTTVDSVQRVATQMKQPPNRNLRAFLKTVFGSTGDPPVPSGDSPEGMGAMVRANQDSLFPRVLCAVPVGGSPTGAGESPALPIFTESAE